VLYFYSFKCGVTDKTLQRLGVGWHTKGGSHYMVEGQTKEVYNVAGAIPVLFNLFGYNFSK